MATQTVTTSAEIPSILEPFYTGTGTGADRKAGLIEQAISQIFPSGAIGPEAYSKQYADLISQGLLGAGSVAGLTKEQQDLQADIEKLGLPSSFASAGQFGRDAASGLSALQNLQAMGVNAPDLLQYQMGPAQSVEAQQVGIGALRGAQTAFNPNLQQFQMGPAGVFDVGQAQAYMSPYMQQVVDVQQRQAIDAARKAQLGQNLLAARQGTYGGGRQAVLQSERESGLRQQLGDIQARGLQDAYSQAQQQFERDRAAQINVGAQNLAAALGVQQLGTQTGLQTALANLSNVQQAQIQQEANRLQAQGMNQQAALQAALANQQAGLTVGQQNLAAALGVQQLGAGQSLEAQRANQVAALQAAQQRLGASQSLGALAQTMGGLGTQQLAGELDILKTRGAFGDLDRAIEQQRIDAQRRDLMEKAQFGQTQVGQLSNILRGIPLSSSVQQATTPPPSFASQLTGMGLTGIGLYNLLGGGK